MRLTTAYTAFTGFSIPAELPQGLVSVKAAYCQPARSATGSATITVPGLDIWGVVRLE